MLQLLFSSELTLLQSTSAGVVAGKPQAVTAATVVGMPLGPLLVPQAGLLSGRHSCNVLYSPPAVGFGLLRWSIARYNVIVVQLSRLFEPHAMGANFCYHTFLVWVLGCSFPFLG